MYEKTEADIIEVTWNNTAGKSNDINTNNNNCNKTKDNKIMYDLKPADKNKSYRIPIATSRITLYDPVHRHVKSKPAHMGGLFYSGFMRLAAWLLEL